MAPAVNGRAPYEFAQLRRHGTYYLNGGDIHFLVENYLFRVHRYFFERESSFFRDKLTVPATPGRPQQGTEDSNAIVLDVRAQDFEQLMWVFYNPLYSIYETGVPQWASILDLAHRWTFPQVKALVVRELEKMFMTPIDRIVLYQKYEVDENLLVTRYAAVVAREEAITIEEGERMGIRTAMRLTQARERLRSGSDGSKSPLPPGCKDQDVREVIMKLFEIPITGSNLRIASDVVQPTTIQVPVPEEPAPTPAPAPAQVPNPAPTAAPVFPEPEPAKPTTEHHLTKTSTKSSSNLKKDTKIPQGVTKPGETNPPAEVKPQQNGTDNKPLPNGPGPIKTELPANKPNGTPAANGAADSVAAPPPPPADPVKSPRVSEGGVGNALRGLFHKTTGSVSEPPSTPVDVLKAEGEGAGTDVDSDFTGTGLGIGKKSKKNKRTTGTI